MNKNLIDLIPGIATIAITLPMIIRTFQVDKAYEPVLMGHFLLVLKKMGDHSVRVTPIMALVF